MLTRSDRDRIELELLEKVQEMRRRFHAKECTAGEYRRVLKQFNDFILDGIPPEDAAAASA